MDLNNGDKTGLGKKTWTKQYWTKRRRARLSFIDSDKLPEQMGHLDEYFDIAHLQSEIEMTAVIHVVQILFCGPSLHKSSTQSDF